MSNKWENDIGKLMKSKAGKLYIKFDKGVKFEEGDTIVMKKKSDELESSLEAGKINQETYERLSESLSFIKYTLHKPPRES
jgi:hypothetical protein